MDGKPLRWIHGEVKTPPMSGEARREMGELLRDLQDGLPLSMPHARPMPSIGRRCHELRVNDGEHVWRLIYRLDADAIVVLEVFDKKTRQTPQHVIETCRARIKAYDRGVL